MHDDDVYTYEPGRDPSGEGGRAFFEAALARDGWRSIRTFTVSLLAVVGFPLWLMLAWPWLRGEVTRPLALSAWAVGALMFGLAFGFELRWGQVLHRLKSSRSSGGSLASAAVPGLERDQALSLLRHRLALAGDRRGVALAGAEVAASALGVRAVLLAPARSGILTPLAAVPAGTTLDHAGLAAARVAFAEGQGTGLGTPTLPATPCLCAPISDGAGVQGVLAVLPDHAVPLRADRAALVAAMARQTGQAFERVRMGAAVTDGMASAISHQLRTPLAVIMGGATTLRDQTGIAPNDRAQMLDDICKESQRMERLVSHLLELGRLGAPGFAVEREPVSFAELLGAALDRVEVTRPACNVNVEEAADLPDLVVDPRRFTDLLAEIIDHAATYSPVEVVARLQQDGTVEVSVADRRSGPADWAHTDLGLQLCHAVAEQHGAELRIEARPEGGTMVRLILPRA